MTVLLRKALMFTLIFSGLQVAGAFSDETTASREDTARGHLIADVCEGITGSDSSSDDSGLNLDASGRSCLRRRCSAHQGAAAGDREVQTQTIIRDCLSAEETRRLIEDELRRRRAEENARIRSTLTDVDNGDTTGPGRGPGTRVTVNVGDENGGRGRWSGTLRIEASSANGGALLVNGSILPRECIGNMLYRRLQRKLRNDRNGNMYKRLRDRAIRRMLSNCGDLVGYTGGRSSETVSDEVEVSTGGDGDGGGSVRTTSRDRRRVGDRVPDRGGRGRGRRCRQDNYNARECLGEDYDGDDDYYIRRGDRGRGRGRLRWDEDCVNCRAQARNRGFQVGAALSGLGNLAGSIAGPLAYWGAQRRWANAYQNSQQAWANSAEGIANECQTMQSNAMSEQVALARNQNSHCRQMQNRYYTYIETNQLSGTDPFVNCSPGQMEISTPSCNGYWQGMFAGGNGFVPGMNGGFTQPWQSAGYTPGFIAGMQGPYGNQNPYGFMNGMGLNGMNGMNGMGLNFNIGLNGAGGYPMAGGPMLNGMYNPNMYNQGFYNPGGWGMVPYSNGNGNYWNGSGGWNNNNMGWNNGGGFNNANWGNIQQTYAMNQQAANYDNYLQQVGLRNQYQQAGYNLWSQGYGQQNLNGYNNWNGAAYSPMNVGASLNGSFNFGF